MRVFSHIAAGLSRGLHLKLLKPFSDAPQGLAFDLIFPLKKSGQQKIKLCELCVSSEADGEHTNRKDK
jgi:hypothetical protein